MWLGGLELTGNKSAWGSIAKMSTGSEKLLDSQLFSLGSHLQRRGVSCRLRGPAGRFISARDLKISIKKNETPLACDWLLRSFLGFWTFFLHESFPFFN